MSRVRNHDVQVERFIQQPLESGQEEVVQAYSERPANVLGKGVAKDHGGVWVGGKVRSTVVCSAYWVYACAHVHMHIN